MAGPARDINEPYAAALRDYVDGAGAAALADARRIGRDAVSAGLSLRDLLALHGRALASIDNQGPAGRAERFLQEVVGPFDAALRRQPSPPPAPGSAAGAAPAGPAALKASNEQLRAALAEARELAVALREDARRSKALAEMGRIIASSLDIDAVYERFAEEVRKLITFDRLDISTVDPAEDTFSNIWVSDRELPGWRAGEVHRLRGSLAGQVVDSRAGIVLTGLQQFTLRPGATTPGSFPARFASLVAVPLIWRDTVVGVLTLRAAAAGAYSEGDLPLAEQIAAHVAGAVANARLYEQSVELASERELRAKLDSRNQELARALEAKTRFVSTMSHELKNPLAALVAAADLLARDKAGDPDSRLGRLAGTMNRSCRQLNLLIGDLIDSSRLAEGALQLVRTRCDLGDLCRDVAETFGPMLSRKRQTVDLLPTDDDLEVFADPDRLQQVIANLLSNASKYSPGGAQIRIRMRRSRERLYVSVEDEGIGIPREDQARLFTPFFRGESRAVRAVPGSGLGLHIARQIVQLHGGDVLVESEPGAGTTVTFHLKATPENGNGGDRQAYPWTMASNSKSGADE